jgi:serine carboxypeptidase-like clade 2
MFPCSVFVVVAAAAKNAEANVIYLETPAGVGYSYSADAAYYQGVDDKMTGTEHSVLL